MTENGGYMQDLYYSHVLLKATAGYLADNGHVDHGSQVGALLVEDDAIISVGVNSEVAGVRYHAEEIVLQRVHTRKDLSRACMYVTLEPCNGNPHHERRHCCEQIADRGVGRLVVLAKKHCHEGGLSYLENHDVDVSVIDNDTFRAIATTLAYGFNKEGQASWKKGPNKLFRNIGRRLQGLSITMGPTFSEEIEAIRKQLGVDLSKLGRISS